MAKEPGTVTDPKPQPEQKLSGSTHIRARILALREAEAAQKKKKTSK